MAANSRARAEHGLFTGGRPPLGFDQAPGKKGYLVINNEEGTRVRLIFEIFLETGNLFGTLARLKQENITTKRFVNYDGKEVGGRDFSMSTLWRLLTNRHYLGEREYNKQHREKTAKKDEFKKYFTAKAVWPAIVSEETFSQTQKILVENHVKYKPESWKRFNYLLTSRVLCPDCHETLIGMSGQGKLGTKYVYYSHRDWRSKCSVARLDAEHLHRIVQARIRKLASHPEILQRMYLALEKEGIKAKPENELRLSDLDKESRVLSKQCENLLDQIQNLPAGIESGPLVQRLNDLKLQKDKLETESANLRKDITQSDEPLPPLEFLKRFVG